MRMETEKAKLRKKTIQYRLPAQYTAEAAGIMALVFLVIMILMNHALRLRAETAGKFALHEIVERERHAADRIREPEISREAGGESWKLEITAPVFRPENSLRLWSLVEEKS